MFFFIFLFCFFWLYFPRYHYVMAGCTLFRGWWSRPFVEAIIRRDRKKKFWHFFLKISTLRGSWIFFDNFSKKKNIFQIKIVKMQIDRYGPQKCCKLNRLKISQKLRLLWLFKVHRIMQNIWKLELVLITLKSANVVGKLISCPY